MIHLSRLLALLLLSVAVAVQLPLIKADSENANGGHKLALPKRCLSIINPMKEGAKEMERQLTQCRSLHKKEKASLESLHLAHEKYQQEKEKKNTRFRNRA
mmetsp:Transcript_34939/g.43171  ORF Transcript_34939/g.43171 Transcript_34939/m.43171 type:complete len:101 (+) Transcript_34939:210-512(+)